MQTHGSFRRSRQYHAIAVAIIYILNKKKAKIKEGNMEDIDLPAERY